MCWGESLVLGLVIINADEVGLSKKLSLPPAPLLSGRGMPKVEGGANIIMKRSQELST